MDGLSWLKAPGSTGKCSRGVPASRRAETVPERAATARKTKQHGEKRNMLKLFMLLKSMERGGERKKKKKKNGVAVFTHLDFDRPTIASPFHYKLIL